MDYTFFIEKETLNCFPEKTIISHYHWRLDHIKEENG